VSVDGDCKLTKHLLPHDEDAAQILASLKHFEMTEKKVYNLLLKFKCELFEKASMGILFLPFNIFITQNGNKYYLKKTKPE